jgi:hypothetical protein
VTLDVRYTTAAMEIRPLLHRPGHCSAPLIATSRYEGFQFLTRLENEFLSGKVRFDAADETLLGACESSTLIGIRGLTRKPHRDDPHTGRVRHLYVSPQWRRHRVGANPYLACDAIRSRSADWVRRRERKLTTSHVIHPPRQSRPLCFSAS